MNASDWPQCPASQPAEGSTPPAGNEALPAPGPTQRGSIDTGGGAVVEGDVRPGVDFVGRDKITNIQYPSTPPPSIDLAAARAKFAALPLDGIPAPAALPRGSRMPLSPNPLFVGREDELRLLAASVKGGATAAIAQAGIAAATGLGGIGKTQLASEFVHRYGQFFAGGVFWISFSDPAAVPAEVASCGGPSHLDLRPDYAALPLADQVRLVRAAWESELPRLLVFDNCETEELLHDWRPRSGAARVVVTSRRARWAPALGVHAVRIGELSRAESIDLLCKHRPDLPPDDSVLDAIAGDLGDLPLALHLAGSFLARYRHVVTPAAYLEQLRDPNLLSHPSLQGRGLGPAASPTEHEQHVGRTFALSMERLDPADPADALARALLARAAHFAPGVPIPRGLLLATLDLDFDKTDAALEAEDALARLVELGLLEEEQEGSLRLHRLLAAFIRREIIDAGEAHRAIEEILVLVAGHLNRVGPPTALLPLQPHLPAVVAAAQVRSDEPAAKVLHEVGVHLHDVGDYAGARLLYEHALEICERVLGAEHPSTLTSLNNLALLLASQGDYAAARPLYERTLAIRERVLGSEHPDTALSLNNLAELLRSQGNYAAARPLLERALAIREKASGAEHPDTALSLNNLAALLLSQGDYAAARPLLERALAIGEKVLRAEDSTTATTLNNLAFLLASQGDHTTARQLFERALAITEKVLGPAHPTTAISLNNLAFLLASQGDYAASRPLVERALTITEKVLGPVHPDTALSLNSMAQVLQSQGDYAAARPLLAHALTITERVLGAEHPTTASILNNLAVLLDSQGDYAAARPLYERALAIRVKVLGPEHPMTRSLRTALDQLPAS